MKLDLLTRAELAKELKICTRTLDLWRKYHVKHYGEGLPGEVRLGPRTIRFKKEKVLKYLLNEY
jgi:hypothetical protein